MLAKAGELLGEMAEGGSRAACRWPERRWHDATFSMSSDGLTADKRESETGTPSQAEHGRGS